MSRTTENLRQIDEDQISATIRDAGVSGAGGGGFPTYAKWEALEKVEHLLVNHQESEPNNYIDKWIGYEHADRLAEFFGALLDITLDTVVIGAKYKDRDPWLGPLEDATDGTVYRPEDLPVDAESETGVVFAYTDNRYEYGMENVLLHTATDTIIGKDLPVDYGWIVQNTETMYNVQRALVDNVPVTRKYVHLDGFRTDGRRLPHCMLDVPIGTPAAALLAAVDVPPDDLAGDRLLAEGGPGWCFEIDASPARFGVHKHTNSLLVLDEAAAAENTYGNDRINVLEKYDWSHPDPATEPTGTVDPQYVLIPLLTNDTYEGIVVPSVPVVERGAHVARGDPVAGPASEGYSPAHHASIDGEVTDVTDRYVEIQRTT